MLRIRASRGALRALVVGLTLCAVLGAVRSTHAQNLTSAEETISVSNTAIGITANLCGTNNTGGAYVQVLSNGIYASFHSATATPDSGDFIINAGTTGPQFWVKPASKLRMIRQSSDSSVKVSCTD